MPFSKHRRGHTFFMIIFFVCLGITTEVFFTAFLALARQQPFCDNPLASMTGHTYVWMAFIYGLIPILGVLFHHNVAHWKVWYRLLFYVALLYVVEFISGYLLQVLTGSCPWEYKTGWHVMGFIQLEYFPAWLLFVWMVERLYIFINERVVQ
ncbi:MAG: hypothetical protein KA841_00760 [Chitinophagales bacterium]|nr:hypothetical protein [Chitinophagales bacterium]